MTPNDILLEAQAIIGERGVDYGGIEENFTRIVEIFDLSTGVKIEPYRAAIFLACVKLARMHQSPRKLDNYLDAINYLAFAASMVDGKNGPLT